MAFFEDLGKKISETSQGAVQKAKDTAEVMKLNGMISDEEKRITSIYTEIGKKYFELHADSAEASLQGEINAIKAAKSKISEYNEQINRLKGVASCPKCGAAVQNGSPFCSTCGEKLETPAAPQGMNRCVNCGSVVAPNTLFCTNCGSRIVQPAPQKTCPACGNNVGDSLFCTKCGAKVNSEPKDIPAVPDEPVVAAPVVPEPVAPVKPEPTIPTEPTVPVQPEPVIPAEPSVPVQPEPTQPVAPVEPTPTKPAAFCTNCGLALESGALFCTNCGNKIEVAPQPVAPVQPSPVIPEPVVPVKPAPTAPTSFAPTNPSVRLCPKCGVILKDGALFCTNCGNKL